MATKKRNASKQPDKTTPQKPRSDEPLYGGKGDQGQMDNPDGPEVYSHRGPHGNEAENEAANTAPDGYGLQDQFGDVDGQDPYSNLDEDEDENEDEDEDDREEMEDALRAEENPEGDGESAGGEGLYDLEESLYGLAEPLAKEGDKSRKARDKDRKDTRGSQDQYGYQK